MRQPALEPKETASLVLDFFSPQQAVRGLALSDRSVDWTEIGVDRAEKMDGTGLRSQVVSLDTHTLSRYVG